MCWSSLLPAMQYAVGEAQANHRMVYRPLPPVVDVETAKECLPSLEERLQGVEQQALAEAARTGEEEVLAGIDQTLNVRRLVDVVVFTADDIGKGLDADRQFASASHKRAPKYLFQATK
ncbi:hypothetical protein HH1059_19500 [Halorhodospira halochloris]|uniref:Uncharacterized protein n=1 Tax=Halorhodospira halochloris TaxID=1052 RepID=A0A110B5W7_HALHR|nr:hypothetical protein HH1059_19500 [Halorhodospira halochloris]